MKVKLNAGYENSQSIEALSGVLLETPIIVIGQNGLKDKARVTVVNTLPNSPTDQG